MTGTEIDPFEAPDNVAPEVAAVVEAAAPEYTDLSLQRRFRIIFGIGVAVLLLMGWVLIRSLGTNDEDSLRERNETLTKTNESQQLLIDKLATQLDAARAQGAAVPAPEVIAAETPGAEVSPVETVAPGVPGERGEAGAAGDVGGAGVAGPEGDVGGTGSAGSKGETGDTGATGGTGSQGTPGAAGGTGDQGSTGAAGAEGQPGPAGPQGDPGVAGPAGPQGEPGVAGPTGGMPGIYHFTFNGVAYTCTQIASGSTTYDCTIN